MKPYRGMLAVLAALAVGACDLARGGELAIDADFPGGNILVDRIEGNVAHVRADLRDTQGWWFYWTFRVRGAAGATVTFRFADRAVGPLGPAVSRDGGRNWQWLGKRESVHAFTYAFAPGEDEVRFSFGMPYQHADLTQFLNRHAGNPHLRVEDFARTRRGTPVELLRLGNFAANGSNLKVWITCRHHACEMMASHVLEGLMEEVLTGDGAGAWLRRHVDFLIVPMVDKDGVEAGDQGKNRTPRDHGQDYTGPSIYPEVAALRRLVQAWAPHGPDVTLDLHNPSINHQVIYTHALRHDRDDDPWNNADDHPRARARRFLEVLERVQQGPLAFRVQDSIEFAQRKATETEPSRAGGMNSAGTRTGEPTRPTHGFRCTLEIPYALVRDTPVTAESARAFGRDLARGLQAHLSTQTKTPPP